MISYIHNKKEAKENSHVSFCTSTNANDPGLDKHLKYITLIHTQLFNTMSLLTQLHNFEQDLIHTFLCIYISQSASATRSDCK